MKKISIYLLAFGLVACNDVLERPLSFEVSINGNDSIENVDGIYRAPVGSTVRFSFDGEPDFISLSYSIFNETNASLAFDTKVSWADNNDNLKLMLSTDFAGLSLTDAHADSAAIRNATWTDLTTICRWPAARNDTAHSWLNLNEYRGQKITLAYCYKTESNAGFQPMFTICNLQQQNVVIKTGEVANTMQASAFGLQPFDMLNLTPDSMAYLTGSASGMWDVTFSDAEDKTAFKIRQTAAGRALNEDWLLSRSFTVPRGKEDGTRGITVKNYYLAVEDYDFTFKEYGEYTLTFYAANANYKYQESKTVTYKFVIYE